MTIRLTGQAQPNNIAGYVDNVFTQVFCTVYNSAGTTKLAHISPYVEGATLQATGATVTLPYDSSYKLCGRAFVKLKNGDSSFTPTVCS